MTAPANTPPAVCGFCEGKRETLVRVGDVRAMMACAMCHGTGLAPTPSDEGRGTEPPCAKCGAPKSSLAHYPHGAAYSHDYQRPIPPPAEGEGAIAKLRRMASGAKGCRDDYGQWVTSAEATAILAALAESQRREQEARNEAGGLRLTVERMEREAERPREMFTRLREAVGGTFTPTAEEITGAVLCELDMLRATVARLTGELEDARKLWRKEREDALAAHHHVATALTAAEATLTALRGKLEQMPGVEIQGTLYIREDRVRAALATITPSDTGSQR